MRAALTKQAEDAGAMTANAWSAMVLKTVSALTASDALKLMGKRQELKKDRRKRASDL